MKKLMMLVTVLSTGCASCPFVDQAGVRHDNRKWVGSNWKPDEGGFFKHPQLGCQTARALGHPEWHRMASDIVVELIKKDELDHKRYADDPNAKYVDEKELKECQNQLWDSGKKLKKAEKDLEKKEPAKP